MENENYNFEENSENIFQPDTSGKSIEIYEIEDFNYDDNLVVPGEYFAHIYEPSVTFNNKKISLNTACIKKFPQIDYVQILINPNEKVLVIRPCRGEEKDSIIWCTVKRKPKQITCKIFYAMVMELMDWNPLYRYKLLGKLIQSNGEYLFVFDLKTPEIYEKTIVEGEKPKTSRIPKFPDNWREHFGVPINEHKARLKINVFNKCMLVSINDGSNVTTSNKTDNEELKNFIEENNNFNGGNNGE